MVVSIPFGRHALDIVVLFLADIKLAADNWLHPGLVGGVYEVHGAENVPVVGHRHRRHTQLFHVLDELFYVTGAIKHGIVGVEMQVDELGHEVSMILCWAHSKRKSGRRDPKSYPQRMRAKLYRA